MKLKGALQKSNQSKLTKSLGSVVVLMKFSTFYVGHLNFLLQYLLCVKFLFPNIYYSTNLKLDLTIKMSSPLFK